MNYRDILANCCFDEDKNLPCSFLSLLHLVRKYSRVNVQGSAAVAVAVVKILNKIVFDALRTPKKIMKPIMNRAKEKRSPRFLENSPASTKRF